MVRKREKPLVAMNCRGRRLVKRRVRWLSQQRAERACLLRTPCILPCRILTGAPKRCRFVRYPNKLVGLRPTGTTRSALSGLLHLLGPATMWQGGISGYCSTGGYEDLRVCVIICQRYCVLGGLGFAQRTAPGRMICEQIGQIRVTQATAQTLLWRLARARRA